MAKQIALVDPVTQELTTIRFGLPEILTRLFDLAFANRASIDELQKSIKALQIENTKLQNEIADLRTNHAEGIAEVAKKFMLNGLETK